MNILTDNDINNWISNGKHLGYNYFLIVKDLEDGEYFPVYFMQKSEITKYKNNVISESKLEVIRTIELL